MRLRALSLWRPFSPAVAAGLKRIECRRTWTGHRGDLAIHAAQKCAPHDHPIWDETGTIAEGGTIGEGGVVIAVVSIVACLAMRRRTTDDVILWDEISIFPSGALCMHRHGQAINVNDQLAYGEWAPGGYGYVLDAVRPLPEPVPVRGMPGMWTLTDEQTDAVYEQL